MSKPKPTWKRRKILIDPKFQFHFTLRLGLSLLFYALLFFNIVVMAPAFPHLFAGHVPEKAMVEVSRRTDIFGSLILLPVACTFLCVFVHGVRLSFRVAGPNYRFQRVLAELRRLRFPSGLHIRKGDYMQETAREFDQTLKTLRAHLLDLKENGVALAEDLRKAREQQIPFDEELLGHAMAVEKALKEIQLIDWAGSEEETEIIHLGPEADEEESRERYSASESAEDAVESPEESVAV